MPKGPLPAPLGAVCASLSSLSPEGRRSERKPKGLLFIFKVGFADPKAPSAIYAQRGYVVSASPILDKEAGRNICLSLPLRGPFGHRLRCPFGPLWAYIANRPRGPSRRLLASPIENNVGVKGFLVTPEGAHFICRGAGVVAPSGQEQYIAHRGPFGATSKAAQRG